MEAGNVSKQKLGDDEVVVEISGAEETSGLKRSESTVHELSIPSSPGISRLSPVPSHTPKPTSAETGIRRRSLYPKPKSRLVEPPYPQKAKVVVEEGNLANERLPRRYGSSPAMNSPGNGIRGAPRIESKRKETPGPVTHKTNEESASLSEGEEEEEEDDDIHDDEVYMTAGNPEDEFEVKKHGKNVKFFILIEWIIFFSLLGILIASLCINKLKNCYIWGLNIWKWCLLVLVVFCGHLVTQWFMDVMVFIIEMNFLLKKKVVYFIYGLKRSVHVVVWLGLILLTWALLIDSGVKRSRKTTRVLNNITRAIACSLIAAFLWMMKDFSVKLLASSFHVRTFFDRIQESIFHQYVLKVLSGPPLLKYSGNSVNNSRLNLKQPKKSGKQKGSGEEVIDVDKLSKIKKEKISARTMSGLIKVIRSSGLSTISELVEEYEENEGAKHKEIRSEFEAKIAAKQVFRKLAKTSNEYIHEHDLLHFMPKERVDNVLQMFEGAAETGKIQKSDFKSWVVKVYQERKYLVHSLHDSKTAIEELNGVLSACIFVIIIVVWLLLMGIVKTRLLIFISSQLLLVVFVFGNSAKALFEAIIFIFVRHPFDVGDRCVIDGVQMVVEEMNILNTIFLRSDNEKIYYPNSVLSTKPISNFNRSPEMEDSLDFSVDFSTSVESIAALKARIKEYLESKPQHWRPNHSVAITEIEDMHKLKMILNVTHTMNFQQFPEITKRRSQLVLELKRIFEDLNIKYHLLPQEVHLRYIEPETQPSIATARRR